MRALAIGTAILAVLDALTVLGLFIAAVWTSGDLSRNLTGTAVILLSTLPAVLPGAAFLLSEMPPKEASERD